MNENTLYGLASLIIGGGFSVIVAMVSRPRPAAAEVTAEQPEGSLSTIADIASVVAAQGKRINELEAGQDAAREREAGQDRVIRALRRYVIVLQETIRGSGIPVPDPTPDDAP
ncbi:hypothetical protein ACFQ60_22295 [Streptomyces zhihengii]